MHDAPPVTAAIAARMTAAAAALAGPIRFLNGIRAEGAAELVAHARDELAELADAVSALELVPDGPHAGIPSAAADE